MTRFETAVVVAAALALAAAQGPVLGQGYVIVGNDDDPKMVAPGAKQGKGKAPSAKVTRGPRVEEPAKPVPTGTVTVTMDGIALPGALISGKVTFSDGETAIWMLDQYGRPGLDPDTPGYRPVQEDVVEFQKQLSEMVRKKGY